MVKSRLLLRCVGDSVAVMVCSPSDQPEFAVILTENVPSPPTVIVLFESAICLVMSESRASNCIDLFAVFKVCSGRLLLAK